MTQAEALQLYKLNDLIALGMAADAVRKQLHPEGIVSFARSDADRVRETLVFDLAESPEQHVYRLEAWRRDRQQSGTPIAILPHINATAVEYLKVLALSRICLDTIPHVQTSWTRGLKLCQIALAFGANDITGPENETHRPAQEQLRSVIRDAGFVPKQRDASFGVYLLD